MICNWLIKLKKFDSYFDHQNELIQNRKKKWDKIEIKMPNNKITILYLDK